MILNLLKARQRSNREIIGFNDHWMMIIGIIILGFLIPIVFFKFPLDLNNPAPFFAKAFTSSIYCAVHWLSSRFIIIFFRRRFPGADQVPKRLALQYTTLISIALIINFGLDICIPALDRVSAFDPETRDTVIASITLTAIVTLIYEASFFFIQWKKSLTEAEKLKREHIVSQLQSLKNQVNPHFLFNSLNTLASLITEDQDKAVNFVQRLSKCYRYILEIKDKEIITLKEELDFLDSFRFLLTTRFGENIDFDIQVPQDELDKEIVPLALQILIENAIKHNIVSTEKPLRIGIFTENGNLIVKNNLQRKQQVMPSTKTGLENIKNRYQFLANKTVDIIVTHTEFIVSLPLLSIK